MKPISIEGTGKTSAEDAAARARTKQAAVRELISLTGRDGSRAFARLPDDNLTREAWELGEAWRQSEQP